MEEQASEFWGVPSLLRYGKVYKSKSEWFSIRDKKNKLEVTASVNNSSSSSSIKDSH
jgi:hypothetical protein